MASIADTIQDIIRRNETTAVELATIAGVSDSAVGRYAQDEAQPKFDTVRQWVRHHPNPNVRLAFANALTGGTDMQVVVVKPVEHATPQGAMQSLHKSMESLAGQVNKAYQALADGTVDAGELRDINQTGAAVISDVQSALIMFDQIHLQGLRKQARRATA